MSGPESKPSPAPGLQAVLPPEVCIASRDPRLRLTDRYVLVEQIGEGGLGTVWKAWDGHLEKFVAIKRIRGDFDAEEALAFMAEGRVVARLHHPNIATVFDIGILEGSPYIVMQFIEGQTLDRAGISNPHDLARILKDVTRALEFSHRHGVLHQDLKPENLMIVKPPGEPERAVVLDFGISRILGGSKRLVGRIGTPGFMSPEQVAGTDVDVRSDIYGLGITFRSLLPPRPASSVVKGMIDRCTAAQPDDRFASMTEMGTALERVASHPRRKKWAVAALVGGLCVLLGSGAYLGSQVIRENRLAAERGAAMERARILHAAGRPEEAYAEALKAGALSRDLRSDILLALSAYEPVWEQKLHTSAIVGVGYLAGGARVVSAGRDSMLRFWDAATGDLKHERVAHDGEIMALAVSSDGTMVATAGRDNRAKLWRGDTGDFAREWEGKTLVRQVAFSPDGRLLAIASEDKSILLCPVDGGPAGRLDGPLSPAKSLAFSDDGTLLAAGQDSGVTHVWNLRDGGSARSLANNQGWTWCTTFTSDRRKVLAGYSNNVIRAWELESGEPGLEWFGHAGFVSSVIPRPGGAMAISSSQDRTIRFWDVSSRKPVAMTPEHPHEVLSMVIDGNRILAGCWDGTVRISDRRWEFGEVTGFPKEGVVADFEVDATGRLWLARVVEGRLKLDSRESTETIGDLAVSEPDARIYPGPGSSMAVVICRLDGTGSGTHNSIEVAFRRNGTWTRDTVSREHYGWSAAGAWTSNGEFHLVHGGLQDQHYLLMHAVHSEQGAWTFRSLGPVPSQGREFSLSLGAEGLELLLGLKGTDQEKPKNLILSLPLERCVQSLQNLEGESPALMKMWRDRSRKIHGVGVYRDDVVVFSDSPYGGLWRRFKTEGEKVASVTGYSTEDGSLEIRWIVRDSYRIRSARLPAR